jgi:hypothetical protein
MGVITEHCQQGHETELKTLANAVKLITPQADGIY